MERTKAASLARTLLNKHGLGRVQFEFSRSKNTLGDCSYRRDPVTHQILPARIRLSDVWVGHLSEYEIRDTILHEIAHALTPGHKHDYVWKAMCRRIGANPARTAETVPQEVKERVLQNTAKYIATCANNPDPRHFHYYFNRLGKRWQRRGAYRCPKCGGSLIPHELV